MADAVNFEREDRSMEENFKSILEENGADVKTTLKRFMGNEALYMKFIMILKSR